MRIIESLDMRPFAETRLRQVAAAFEDKASIGREAGAPEALAAFLESFGRMLVAAADGGVPVRAVAVDLAGVAVADLSELHADLEELAAVSRGLGDDQGRVLVEAVQQVLLAEITSRDRGN